MFNNPSTSLALWVLIHSDTVPGGMANRFARAFHPSPCPRSPATSPRFSPLYRAFRLYAQITLQNLAFVFLLQSRTAALLYQACTDLFQRSSGAERFEAKPLTDPVTKCRGAARPYHKQGRQNVNWTDRKCHHIDAFCSFQGQFQPRLNKLFI